MTCIASVSFQIPNYSYFSGSSHPSVLISSPEATKKVTFSPNDPTVFIERVSVPLSAYAARRNLSNVFSSPGKFVYFSMIFDVGYTSLIRK
jgi:hypothetical protein